MELMSNTVKLAGAGRYTLAVASTRLEVAQPMFLILRIGLCLFGLVIGLKEGSVF